MWYGQITIGKSTLSIRHTVKSGKWLTTTKKQCVFFGNRCSQIQRIIRERADNIPISTAAMILLIMTEARVYIFLRLL